MKKIAIRINPEDDIRIIDAGSDINLVDVTGSITVLGWVCDDSSFGDNFDTDCMLYRKGTCPSEQIRDNYNRLWHLLRSK